MKKFIIIYTYHEPMRAARFKEKGGNFTIEDIERPTIDSNEVLIEIKAASICGTDVAYYNGDSTPRKLPGTLGHEGAGVIAEVGEQVQHLEPGDHVIPHYIVSCGVCKPCLQGYDNRCRNRETRGAEGGGTFAEYMRLPAENAMKMDDEIPFDQASIAGCAVATAYHAVNRANMEIGDTVVVFGVGGVGVHTVMWAKKFGASNIAAVDIQEDKVESAKMYGADRGINSRTEDVASIIDDITDGYGVDIAFTCVPSEQATEQALESIQGKNKHETGTVVCVDSSSPIEAEYWGIREGNLTVPGDHTKFELWQIIKMLENGKIDLNKSITHKIALSDINNGVELINSDENTRRVVIDMTK